MKLLSKSIIDVESTPVYDLEVAGDTPNFCLANGVVVHNSKDMSDSSCGAAWNIRSHLKWFATLPKRYQVAMAQQVLNELYGQNNPMQSIEKKIAQMAGYTDDEDDD